MSLEARHVTSGLHGSPQVCMGLHGRAQVLHECAVWPDTLSSKKPHSHGNRCTHRVGANKIPLGPHTRTDQVTSSCSCRAGKVNWSPFILRGPHIELAHQTHNGSANESHQSGTRRNGSQNPLGGSTSDWPAELALGDKRDSTLNLEPPLGCHNNEDLLWSH